MKLKTILKLRQYFTRPIVNIVILVVFLALFLFSNNEYSLRSKVRYQSEIEVIERRIEELRSEIVQDSVILRQIMVSDKYLERYSRENLFMCEPDEVIFRINE